MTFIDFFSGIGGFRLGMEMAGHICLGHCEIDKFADKSYRAMHKVKESEWYADDICGVDPRDLPEADCYCGGFPCQTFSIAGRRGGFEDTRGTLIFELLRLAKERKPKYLFLENVAGLLNHKRGRTFATILCAISEVGYDVEWQVLNSKDYAVPQNRDRVFIIGHLRGKCTGKVFPIGQNDGIPYIESEPNERQSQAENCATALRATGTMKADGMYIIDKKGNPKNKDFASCLTGGGHSGGNHSDMDLLVQPVLTPDRIEKRQNGRRFKNSGDDMFTLTAQDRHGVAIYKVQQNVRIRRLTPLESFRLQGFPDDMFYKARSVNSDSQLYKQAGNSVTVNVIYEIAKRFNKGGIINDTKCTDR